MASIKIKILGYIFLDNGREIRVSAGFKYTPRPQSKENSSLFEAIEDVEQNVIDTPL